MATVQMPIGALMTGQDWFVSNQGQCLETEKGQPGEARPYRLYRFLADLDDVLAKGDEGQQLQVIAALVCRLLNTSEWLHLNFLPPEPDTGWSVVMLYDEPDYPITIQNVAWSPGSISPIHNHATWGIVALLSGQEKNTFWKRSPTPEHPDRIEPVGSQILYPGDILCLMPDTIHQVEVMGDEPTISFNLYGETNFDQRFEFDLERRTARHF
jgi:predicted metal-dependent enzyme (double-stranded beta helix superfamily)